MLRRRLYLQIYFTIIASLVIVVVLSGLLWSFYGRDRMNHQVFDITGRLAYLSLPAADAPDSVQRDAVKRLGRELGIDISLFDRQQRPINPVVLTYPAEFVEATRGRRYEMAYGPWVFAVIHPVNYLGVSHSADADNRNGYNNPEFDAAFDKMVETIDADEILDLAGQLEEMLIADAAYVVVHGYGYIDVVRPEVGGWTPPRFLRDYFSHVRTWLK